MSNHNTVAHNWANQSGRARKGFNMYYDGATIFSYGSHFPIARIVHNDRSDRAYLMTDKSYSVSTAKHKSIVWRAMGSNWPVFVVHDVNALTAQSHVANFERMLRAASDSIDKSKRARKYASSHLDDARQSVDKANAYSDFFQLALPKATLESLDASIAEIEARAEATRAKAEQARIEQARAKAKADRERLLAWLNGADVYPPHTRVPYVRVHGDTVETTWGAEVPLTDALRAWDLLKLAREQKRDLTGIEMYKVGNFNVDSITPTGMRAGCHFIPYRFARLAACRAGLE